MTLPRHRICYVVASEITATAFLIDQIREASARYDVTIALNTRNPEFLIPFGIDVSAVRIPIERKISLSADFSALLLLYKLFRSSNFDLVHSVSPKAGLLAMLAGFLAGVPRRLHVFTGQVWVTRTGIARLALKQLDRLLAALATQILIDSPSQRDFLVAQGVVSSDKCTVLGKGSISGVDTTRFRPDANARALLRQELNIPADGILFIYLGRLNRDKGVLDLAAAFSQLCQKRKDVWLLLVGPDEAHLHDSILQICASCPAQLRLVDYTNQPERYMAAADVFCLPSYREGFGTVIIEAAACGVPAVASRIYGITDAIVEGKTGLLHAPGDTTALTAAMARLADDPALRRTLGETARARALVDFQASSLTSALLDFYAKILN